MSHFFAADGLRLHFDDRGSGVPVLCLPGLTRNMADFDPVLKLFETRARCVRLDLRGRGGSDWAEEPSTYSIPHEAQDVLTLLDHLEQDKIAILGTSRGGLVALALAMMAPDRLAGVCFNDIGPIIEQEGLDHIMTYLGKRPPYNSYEEAAQAMPALNPGFHGVDHATWLAHVRRMYIETGDRLDIRYDPKLRDAVEAYIAEAHEPVDCWPMFDALADRPLALVYGANSNILSEATVAEMRKRRPDMGVARLPDRGHVPFLDEPAAQAVLIEWLDALGKGPHD
ncbi:MAG: alpha/beta hydrolase [Pseudomonadota bacterium]